MKIISYVSTQLCVDMSLDELATLSFAIEARMDKLDMASREEKQSEYWQERRDSAHPLNTDIKLMLRQWKPSN